MTLDYTKEKKKCLYKVRELRKVKKVYNNFLTVILTAFFGVFFNNYRFKYDIVILRRKNIILDWSI